MRRVITVHPLDVATLGGEGQGQGKWSWLAVVALREQVSRIDRRVTSVHFMCTIENPVSVERRAIVDPRLVLQMP